ncbi:hypothetical protein CK203_110882 [Vitis vinifera]|uniref:C-JID domain-containing protein n=1 Tax=Vitis vinifera TaxID=29760 RepID=A0A438FF26_VITVI|nr:hypothetical protein CK203_110882 [Vitis vinifera]
MMDGVAPSDLWCLSLLEDLDLSQNSMCHIPIAITQLCNLRRLNISHCKMLEEIPELPSSLRKIDAHDCPIFGTLSNPSTLLWSFLLKWFKTVEPPLKWRSINLGGNGIPRWVLHQEMGSQIRIELPMNCDCLKINDSESDQVLLVYYPKIAIRDKFHSNQYMHLQASFNPYYQKSKIKSCGVHLIYSQDDQQQKAMKRSRDDAEHNQAEEPHHKRSREPNTHLKL